MKNFVLLSMCVLVIAGVLLVYYKSTDKTYVGDYFEQIGLGSFFYKHVIESIGVPLREVEEPTKYNDWLTLYYDQYELDFVKKFTESKEQYFLMSVRITGKEVRFGKYKIGVGSSYKQVERAYRGHKKLVENYGFIDSTTWVQFDFDDNNNVKSILLYCGP